MNKSNINVLTWGLSALTTLLAIFAWGQGLQWHIAGASTYKLFPVFGLIAFSLMWTHYIAIVAKIIFKVKLSMMASYFKLTHFVVVLALLLHPGLLVWQLWRDKLGLPPESYFRVYGWLTLLGTVSWLTFLGYELRVKFEDRPWWKHVVNASELAMIGIYYHALRLGGQLQHGWYKMVWYFYGVTLAAALCYIHYRRWYIKKLKSKSQNLKDTLKEDNE